MALNYQFGTTIQRAIRNLCLGRVLLQDDMDIGDDVVPVKWTYLDDSNVLPGGMLFHNNTDSAVLVQPTAADVPDGIEHQESVTIDTGDTYSASDLHGDITLSDEVENEYTVARGAYIRMATLPSVSQGLKWIQSDFIPATLTGFGVPDNQLPGVVVVNRGSTGDSFTSQEIGFAYRFRIYYVDLLKDDRDNTGILFDNAEQLRDLLLEDNYLGGTCLCSDFAGMRPWHASEWGGRGMKFHSAMGVEIGWVEIDFEVQRPELWNKAPIVG